MLRKQGPFVKHLLAAGGSCHNDFQGRLVQRSSQEVRSEWSASELALATESRRTGLKQDQHD